MTAQVIDIRTRQPVPLHVKDWRPSVGERIFVLIPEMEMNGTSCWPAVVCSGSVNERWMVELDHIPGRRFAVSLSEMRQSNVVPIKRDQVLTLGGERINCVKPVTVVSSNAGEREWI